MKIVSETIEDVNVLVLTGELDTRGNLVLDKVLKDLAQTGSYKAVLDLTAIRFMGNQTISILLSNLKEYRAGKGNIKMLNPQRTVFQYLKSHPMYELFQIYSSKTEAVMSFAKDIPPGKVTVEIKSQTVDKEPAALPKEENLESKFATGEILFANSCMLATLIKTLEQKGILTSQEVFELLNPEQIPLKGELE